MAINLDSAQDIRVERQAEGAGVVAQSAFLQVREGQSIVVRFGGVEVGSRPVLNLIAGANISLSVVDDALESEVEITVTLAASPDVTSLKVAGTQVVGARQTGWTPPTGTATRTSFDTATVTLPQLAEAVKALADDLVAHGIIGP